MLESVAVTTAIGLAVDFSIHYGINYGLLVENSRESAVGFTLARMGGPTLMAALTTSAAGFFMLPSSVLAYIQVVTYMFLVFCFVFLRICLIGIITEFLKKGFLDPNYKE